MTQAHNLHLQITPEMSLSPRDRTRHMLVTGTPGTGMSTFLLGLIKQDLYAGRPAVVLDPYGELSRSIISEADEHTRSRIVYLDFGSTEFPVGINIFEDVLEQERHQIVQVMTDLMYALYDPEQSGIIGPRFENTLKNGIHTVLHDEQPSMAELIRCYTDRSYIEHISPKIGDLLLSSYWKSLMDSLPEASGEINEYLLSKIGMFVSDKRLRLATCQPRSSLTLDAWANEQRVIVCDFRGVRSSALHMTILSWLQSYVLLHQIRNRPSPAPLSLYIDEIAFWPEQFVTSLIDNGRLYKTDLVVTTQRLAFLSDWMVQHALRMENIVAFRSSTPDAPIIAEAFHTPHITNDALALTPQFHAYLKLMIDGNPQITHQPHRFSLDEVAGISDDELSRLLQEQRQTHARPAGDVEAAIQSRMEKR